MALLLSVLAMMLTTPRTYALTGTWKQNPIDGNWQNGANWSVGGPPNDAIFGASNVTDIFNQLSCDSITFNPGASAYTITPLFSPEISGSGIINSSGIEQNFETIRDQAYFFENSATITGDIVFTFADNSNSGASFSGTSSAGSATFVCGLITGVDFRANATAGAATFILNDGSAQFFNESSAGTATLIAQGGAVDLEDDSTADMARVILLDSGVLEVFNHRAPGPTVGSIEGDGTISLGSPFIDRVRNLNVGANDLNTTFSGLIEDHDRGGSLTKVGKGTLILTGGNTYTRGTTVERGRLIANNTSGSATGTGPVRVNVGTFGGRGIIAGAVIIGRGGTTGAALAPGTNGLGLLTLQSALAFGSNGTYNWDINVDSLHSDEAVAQGVTIADGALFAAIGHGETLLPPGMVFTAINNTAATPIIGTFSDLVDGAIVTVNGSNLQASYTGGDGNDLTLTVVP